MSDINIAALNMFRTANNWTADSIANLNGDDAIKKVGDYGLPVVKELTDELIDELGPKVLKEYFRN